MDDLLFDKKDIFSWANCEEAKQYIGKKGYFADAFSKNIEDWKQSTLIAIDDYSNTDMIFKSNITGHGLFLPIDKVKNPEKKWRAFENCNEFLQKTKITVGTVIHVEISPNLLDWRSRYHVALLGYTTDSLIFPAPLNELSFQTLFNEVQLIEDDGTLKPFGVEE